MHTVTGRALTRIALASLMAASGLAMTAAAAPTEAAAASCAFANHHSVSGTAEGQDGRFVSAQVSIELFTAEGTKIGMDGCPMGAGYAATTLVNEKPGTTCCFILPAEGSATTPYTTGGTTYDLEKTWSIGGIPANAATVWIETYTKKIGSVTDNSRYGNSLRRPIALSSSNIAVRQPLVCGVTDGGATGTAATLVGKVFDNGQLVTPSRVSAFSTSPDGGNTGAIRSFQVANSHPTNSYRVEPLTPGVYTLFVTVGGATYTVKSIPVTACGENVQDIAIRGGLPRTTGVPVSGDWDGDGDDEPGIFADGQWVLRSDAGPEGLHLPTFDYGAQPGDIPVVGDWDGNGKDDAGIFRRGRWHLRSSAEPGGFTIANIPYGGSPGDLPAPGDWDGDEDDEPGIFRRGGEWHFRENAEPGGRTAARAVYGLQAGDVPVPGDWDGDGDDEPGIYRRGTWHARTTAGHDGRTYKTFTYGLSAGDVALKGNWDGDPGDEPGIYRLGDWHLRGSIGAQSTIHNYIWPA